jgi:hypothetical protein
VPRPLVAPGAGIGTSGWIGGRDWMGLNFGGIL